MRGLRNRLVGNKDLRLALALSTAVSTFTLATRVQAAEPHECQKVFDEKLAEAAVTDSDIRYYTVAKNWVWHRNDRHLAGYSAWVGLKGCKGSIVIEVSEECWHQQSYVRGPCQVEGLKSY